MSLLTRLDSLERCARPVLTDAEDEAEAAAVARTIDPRPAPDRKAWVRAYLEVLSQQRRVLGLTAATDPRDYRELAESCRDVRRLIEVGPDDMGR